MFEARVKEHVHLIQQQDLGSRTSSTNPPAKESEASKSKISMPTIQAEVPKAIRGGDKPSKAVNRRNRRSFENEKYTMPKVASNVGVRRGSVVVGSTKIERRNARHSFAADNK